MKIHENYQEAAVCIDQMSLKYLQLIADLMKISKLQLHLFFVKREKKIIIKGETESK